MQRRLILANNALLIGGIAMVCCLFGLSLPMGAVGVIVALLSRGSYQMEKKAKIGLALSLAAIAYGIYTYVSMYFMMQTPEYSDMINQILNAYGLEGGI